MIRYGQGQPPKHDPRVIAKLAALLLEMDVDTEEGLLLLKEAARIRRAIAGAHAAAREIADELRPILEADAAGWLDALRWPEHMAQNATPTVDDMPGMDFGPGESSG